METSWSNICFIIDVLDFTFKFSYYKKLVPVVDPMTVSMNTSTVSTNYFDPYPSYLQSAISQENHVFPPQFEPHKVAGYFDIKEFAVLSSAHSEPLENESKLKALMSSACIALNNTNS